MSKVIVPSFTTPIGEVTLAVMVMLCWFALQGRVRLPLVRVVVVAAALAVFVRLKPVDTVPDWALTV